MNLVYRKAHPQASYPLMTWPSLQGAFWCVLHPEQHLRRCDEFPAPTRHAQSPFNGAKGAEDMNICLICGTESHQVEIYSFIVKRAQVCHDCAENVANAYNMAQKGQWLTWEMREKGPCRLFDIKEGEI